ncbi:CLUMA_CG011065, isoform A [Clunio marinus]|uniref:RING-type E3 ubiquitin transferase n=1 Tax=Clunio marinus TaxID=568069 RepID=A0A1J1IBN3_9DIPT|nr:CLUMA_CG011065, isoform A [Clunio marinus]
MHQLTYALSLVILLGISECICDVLVYRDSTNQIIDEFPSLAARFGPSLPPNGMRVLAVGGSPPDGCSPMEDAPKANFSFHGFEPKFAAIIIRGTCSFADKVRHAQNASFDAVIVYNKNSNDLEIMSASDDSDIFIPSVFVGRTGGDIILEEYLYINGFALVLNDDFPFNINTHLIIPFCIVVGLCFIIMFGFMIARCVRERRRVLRYRLPTSSLKKLESRRFTKNEIYDTCAICLDDYEEGDKLRILPCRHAYHTKCIDVWLTKNRRVCPVCKRKVYTIGERRRNRRRHSADSTTDSMSSHDPDDRTPLINNQGNNNVNHGTFNGEIQENDQSRAEEGNVGTATNAEAEEDDEILDGNQRSAFQRFNPFDRVPNLPPQLVDELGASVRIEEPESRWEKFTRFFSFRQQHPSNDNDDPPLLDASADDVDIIIEPNDNLIINSMSGNNILNSNLSGSFRNESNLPNTNDDDDADDDDEILDGRERRKVPRRNRRKHRSAPNIMTTDDQPSTSYDMPPSSSINSSPSNRLGVAAIPNIQFDPFRSNRRN